MCTCRSRCAKKIGGESAKPGEGFWTKDEGRATCFVLRSSSCLQLPLLPADDLVERLAPVRPGRGGRLRRVAERDRGVELLVARHAEDRPGALRLVDRGDARADPLLPRRELQVSRGLALVEVVARRG